MPRKKKSTDQNVEASPEAHQPLQAASEAQANTTDLVPVATVEPIHVIEVPAPEPVFLNIPDPPAPVVQVAPTHGEKIDVPPPPVVPEVKVRIARLNGMTAEEELDLIRQAEVEDLHRNFAAQLAQANRAAPVNVMPPPQPVAPRIAEQTRLEMEAGKAAVAKHAAAQSMRAPRPAEPPTSVPIFRPDDYVPNNAQGNIQATAHNLK